MPPTVTEQPTSTTQHTAALALAAIVGEGLTPIGWSVRRRAAKVVEWISGQVHGHPDNTTRAVVAEYAALLGADVTEKRSSCDTFTTVSTTGVFEGVSVCVWGHVEETPSDAVAEVERNAARLEAEHAEDDLAREQIAAVSRG